MTALAAAIAALLSGAVSLFIADRLVTSSEDIRLRSTASLVIREMPAIVEGESEAQQAKRAKAAVDEEVEELAPESLRVAVRASGGALIGGDPQLPVIEAGACESRTTSPSAATTTGGETTILTLRSCAAATNRYHVVVAATRQPRGLGLILLSCALASLIAGIVAAILARKMADWSLAPLTRLRSALETVGLDSTSTNVRSSKPVFLPAMEESAAVTSEVLELRSAINSLVGRLALSVSSARRFSSDAAHELKTPLTVLLGEIDLLAEERGATLDEETRAAIAKLRARIKALTRLVERLLVLSMASSGEQPLISQSAVVSLEDVAREVIQRLDAKARARVTFHADAAATGNGNVRGDEVLLRAVVENAIENALKFSEDEVTVTIAELEDLASVRIDVRDKGPGISKEHREHAFEPFFRAPESRAKTPGHGIGLALVAQIVAAHSGTASFVDPGSSGGAHLRVTLPMWSGST